MTMKKILFGLATAGLLVSAAPSFAQVGVDIGPGGVGVEVGRDRDRDYRRDRYEDRREYRERRGYRVYGERCRTVVMRDRRPDGDVVIRRIRRCG
jgi:hypothetical protein